MARTNAKRQRQYMQRLKERAAAAPQSPDILAALAKLQPHDFPKGMAAVFAHRVIAEAQRLLAAVERPVSHAAPDSRTSITDRKHPVSDEPAAVAQPVSHTAPADSRTNFSNDSIPERKQPVSNGHRSADELLPEIHRLMNCNLWRRGGEGNADRLALGRLFSEVEADFIAEIGPKPARNKRKAWQAKVDKAMERYIRRCDKQDGPRLTATVTLKIVRDTFIKAAQEVDAERKVIRH